MVRLWKIMFDLVFTMSIGVLLRLEGGVRKNRRCQKNKMLTFLKSKSFSELTKKVVIVTQLLSARIRFEFLKGFFTKDFSFFLFFLCFSVCHTLFTLFNGLFAPTSRSPMSKLFRYSESLGKSNQKKWSQSWTFLLKNGVKSQSQFLRDFFFISFLRLTVILEDNA